MRPSCDLSCSEAASEGEEFSSRLFDIAGCDSSATDEDGDYEPRPSRKRGVAPVGGAAGKKVKQEATSAEDYDTAANITSMGLAVTAAVDVSQDCRAPSAHSQITHTLLPNKPLTPCPQPRNGQDPGCEGSVNPGMEPLVGGSCMTGTTDQAERRSSATGPTEKMAGRVLL